MKFRYADKQVEIPFEFKTQPYEHQRKVVADTALYPYWAYFLEMGCGKSKILLDKIMSDYEKNPDEIWDLEIFGRKLSEVVNDGIKAKLYMLPDEAQYKFRESLEKVVNKGKGGILAFIL